MTKMMVHDCYNQFGMLDRDKKNIGYIQLFELASIEIHIQ